MTPFRCGSVDTDVRRYRRQCVNPSYGVSRRIVHEIRTYVNFRQKSSLHLGGISWDPSRFGRVMPRRCSKSFCSVSGWVTHRRRTLRLRLSTKTGSTMSPDLILTSSSSRLRGASPRPLPRIRAVYHDILEFSARVLVTVSASSSYTVRRARLFLARRTNSPRHGGVLWVDCARQDTQRIDAGSHSFRSTPSWRSPVHGARLAHQDNHRSGVSGRR